MKKPTVRSEGSLLMRWDWFEGLNENAPIDVLPASNNEFYPLPPTQDQKMIMAVQDKWIEEARDRYKMSRRHFVRTGMALAIGLAAIDVVRFRRADAGPLGPQPGGPDYCEGLVDHYNKVTQLNNPPGEFIFDVQSHHVMSDGVWRAELPVHWAVIAGIFGLADNSTAPTEADPTEYVGRVHYMRNMFLESATNMTVISPVPAAPDITNPLPLMDATESAEIFQRLSGGTNRSVVHKFCMPNRGSTMVRPGNVAPAFMQAEFDEMWSFAANDRVRKYLRGWKVYSPYADVPFAPSWQHDDDIGQAYAQTVLDIHARYPEIRPIIASHKGPILPGFNGNSNAPQDVGPAAKMFPGINFVIYHSGHNSGFPNPDATTAVSPDKSKTYYPGDDTGLRDADYPHSGDNTVNSGVNQAGQHISEISVDTLIKSLRSVGLDGPHNKARASDSHGNTPNVYAEIGSTWKAVASNKVNAAHLLGKLVWHVGPRRVVWGTDSIWYGSPQDVIVLLRALDPIYDPVTGKTSTSVPAQVQQIWDTYKLPFGLQGDRFDPQVDCTDAGAYTVAHPNASRPELRWPTDAKPHPERSIRNGIFGRNAAEPYGLEVDDPDRVQAGSINQFVNCDDLNKLRNEYWVNQFTDINRQTDPDRVLYRIPSLNTMAAPRTPAEVAKLRKLEGWVP